LCGFVRLRAGVGAGLARPRRLGIPSPEGERRMTNAHLKVLHFDLESSLFLPHTSDIATPKK